MRVSPGQTAPDLRLPKLRRPAGWGALDAAGVRSRAAQVYMAHVSSPFTRAATACEAPPDGDAPEVTFSSPSIPVSVNLAQPAAGIGAKAVGAEDRYGEVGPGTVAGSKPRRLFPWAALVGGAVLAPWVVWAPILGGLSFGVLMVQTGLLQRWLAQRPGRDGSDEPHAVLHSNVSYSNVSHSNNGAAEPTRASPGRGWLLVAMLLLVGIQAAMLITTVHLKHRQSADMASIFEASQRNRSELRARLQERQKPAAAIDDDRGEQQMVTLPIAGDRPPPQHPDEIDSP